MKNEYEFILESGEKVVLTLKDMEEISEKYKICNIAEWLKTYKDINSPKKAMEIAEKMKSIINKYKVTRQMAYEAAKAIK
ncbi:MAG: hypothetical protein E7242_01150 [Lachnospiraceae bacterium]|nr:hypothetical protein [Lachnospiraceae bacterium]